MKKSLIKTNNNILFFIYVLILASVFTLFWSLNFLNKDNIQKLEDIEIIIIGIIAFTVLIFFEDTFYVAPLIIFTPFIYARSFFINGTPTTLIIAVGIVIFGFIGHLILHGVRKLTRGKLFFGIVLLMIAMTLGGINLDNPDKLRQILIMFGIGVCFVLVYVFFVSTMKNKSFDKVCYIISFLGLMIVVQSIVFYLELGNKELLFESKILDLGWGCSNNCAMMYLLILPFSIYLVATKKGILSIFFGIVSCLQGLFLILTFSRGGIIAYAFLIVIISIDVLIFSKKKISPLITTFSSVVIFIVVALVLFSFQEETFTKMLDIITKADFTDFNGRKDIYTRVFENFKLNPIFGKGFLTSSTAIGTETEDYLWAHGTIFQTAESFGTIGLVALVVHFFEKYWNLIKKINLKKAMILCSFLGSGLYGLFDISYYYINYMVVIVLIFVFMDRTIDQYDNEIEYWNEFSKKNNETKKEA